MADDKILLEREETWGRFLKWVVWGTLAVAVVTVGVLALLYTNTGGAVKP